MVHHGKELSTKRRHKQLTWIDAALDNPGSSSHVHCILGHHEYQPPTDLVRVESHLMD